MTLIDGHLPQLAGGDHTLSVSGDAAARAQVTQRLQGWFGWRQIIDLGDISTARGAEMILPLWLRLWGALGTGQLMFRWRSNAAHRRHRHCLDLHQELRVRQPGDD